MMLDEQPVCPPTTVAVVVHPDEDKAAMQLFAIQRELEVAFLKRLLRRFLSFRLPVAAIPKHHGTTAVLAFGDRPLEVTIIERMVLDLDCKPLITGIEGRSFGDSPGCKDAVQFEAKVIMKPSGVVLLDNET
jgi:hypothetical protein